MCGDQVPLRPAGVSGNKQPEHCVNFVKPGNLPVPKHMQPLASRDCQAMLSFHRFQHNCLRAVSAALPLSGNVFWF